MIAEFITPADKRWKQFLLQTKHDFYHLPSYVALAAEQEEGYATAFYAENGAAKFLVPLLLRSLPTSLGASPLWRDATNPYGYPAPLLYPEGDMEQLQLFLQAFREAGLSEKIVSVFLRLHPLLPMPVEPMEEFGEVIRHGQTIYMDLKASEEEILRGIRKNHRYDIRKLTGAGYVAQMDHWEHYTQFVDIYRATMRRVEADDAYLFEGPYFERLRDTLGDVLHICTVSSPQGDVAAGALFTNICGIVQYHLSGTADAYQHDSPNKLMVDCARHWAVEQGAEYFHMGGGVGAREDSLFTFKSGFSRLRSEFLSYRMIFDEDKYQKLLGLWRDAGGVPGDDSYFPLYRKPTERRQADRRVAERRLSERRSTARRVQDKEAGS